MTWRNASACRESSVAHRLSSMSLGRDSCGYIPSWYRALGVRVGPLSGPQKRSHLECDTQRVMVTPTLAEVSAHACGPAIAEDVVHTTHRGARVDSPQAFVKLRDPRGPGLR